MFFSSCYRFVLVFFREKYILIFILQFENNEHLIIEVTQFIAILPVEEINK